MTNIIKEIYTQKIKEAQILAHPRVLINVCSHGDETVGLDLKSKFDDFHVANGSLTFNVANLEGVRLHKRIVETDLNRSFPGNEHGSYEEKIAFYMMQYVPLFDYVIDVHSTVSGMKDCIIIEDNSNEVQKMISACGNCKTVLHMLATKGKSLFTASRSEDRIIPAIAFEYGDNSTETLEKCYEDIVNVLKIIHLLEGEKTIFKTEHPRQFECYAAFPKNSDDVIDGSIKNYNLVKKGDIVGHTSLGEEIISPEDFYPILFGEITYTTIFGFMGRDYK